MDCWSWLILFIAVGLVSFIGANLARIKRDGLSSSNETIQGLPREMGFTYRNDCNDSDSLTNG